MSNLSVPLLLTPPKSGRLAGKPSGDFGDESLVVIEDFQVTDGPEVDFLALYLVCFLLHSRMLTHIRVVYQRVHRLFSLISPLS